MMASRAHSELNRAPACVSTVPRPQVSVIIPVFNEAESIPALCNRLYSVLGTLSSTFEVIAVNDGSIDQSAEILQQVAREHASFRVINFSRNFGQTAALMAGIDHSAGDIIVAIDADLQNDPEDIPIVLAKIAEGYDVVSGWRQDRKDATIRRNLASRIANRLISRISGVTLHDYGCTLKAYRRSVIKEVRLYGEMHRFIPIYASWVGAKVTEIPVRHHARRFGKSNYGINRVAKVLLDLMVVKFLDRYLVKPIYIFGGFGFLSLAASVLVLLTIVYLRVFEGISMILTPLPLLAAITFLVGIMSILLGLLAEVVVRTYFESQSRTIYSVRSRINFEND